MDDSSVIASILDDPKRHLGQRTLSALENYLRGFEYAHMAYEYRSLEGRTAPGAWHHWLHKNLEMTTEHKSRLGAMECFGVGSYARFMADDDHTAFDLWISLRKQLEDEFPAPPSSNEYDPGAASQSLLDVFERIFETPGMYLGGSKCSTQELYAFTHGYLACERALGKLNTPNQRLMAGFKKWINERYPFGKSRPWGHTFHFFSMSNGAMALKKFAEHLGVYIDGEPPDSVDHTQRQIIESIMEHARKNASPTSGSQEL